MKLLLLVAAILAAASGAGCAASPVRIKQAMDPWVGQNVNALVTRWGAPTAVTDLFQGAKVYTWLYHGPTLVQGISNTLTTVSSEYCRFDWVTNATGVIESYRSEGSCRIIRP